MVFCRVGLYYLNLTKNGLVEKEEPLSIILMFEKIDSESVCWCGESFYRNNLADRITLSDSFLVVACK